MRRMIPCVRLAADYLFAHPKSFVMLTALLSVTASTYPVLFFGRSFVSPNTGGIPMLYSAPPFLPGLLVEEPEDASGTDLGALMWASVSYTFIEHRAIFRDHEPPLWNRYNAAGRPLLGQGLSMLGDPLHWIPLLAGGEAWAWDVKFVLAKFLFILGIGLTVLAATGFLPAALTMTVAAAFTGVFVARINHPALFAVCYAPWMLLPLLRLCDTQSRTRRLGWALVLAVAGVALTNCGTVKEAYLMLIVMGGAGFLACALAPISRRSKCTLCGSVVLFGAGLACFTFVSWGSFLDALSRAVTLYDTPAVATMKPGFFLALFDSIFVNKMLGLSKFPIIPTSVVVLFAMTWAVVRIDLSIREPVFLALGAVSLALPAGMFGVIPPEFILKIPLLNNVHHIDQTFSHLLTPLMLVLGGFGLRAFWVTSQGSARWPFILYAAAIVLVFAAYYAQLEWSGVRHSETLISWPTFLLAFAIAGPLWARRWIREKRVDRWTLGLLLLGVGLAIGKYGMHLETHVPAIDAALLNPKHRPSFSASSQGIEQLKIRMTEPARVVGPDDDLFPGYQGVIDLEGIGGADPLGNPLYREFLQHMGVEKNTWGWLDVVNRDVVRQSSPVFDMLNVRYLVVRNQPGTNVCPDGTPIIQADLLVCERSTPWPRAFFTDRIREYTTLDELRALAEDSRGHPFAALQASDAEAQEVRRGLPKQKGSTSIAAHDYRLTANSTRFSVTAGGPGLIVLQEAYEKGQFAVTVNDQPAEYIRVNHAFKGIPVSQSGEYRIAVTFQPAIGRWYGATLWIGGALMLASILVLAWIRMEPKESGNPTAPT